MSLGACGKALLSVEASTLSPEARMFWKQLPTARRNVRYITYDTLPDYIGPRAEPIYDAFPDGNFWYRVGRDIERASDEQSLGPNVKQALDRTQTFLGGPVQLTHIRVEPIPSNRRDPGFRHFNWHFAPAVIGRLPSGQPVLVFQVAPVRWETDRREEVAIRNNIADTLFASIAAPYSMRYSVRFYGLQRLSNQLMGLIFELPPAGHLFQFGGTASFTSESLEQLHAMILKAIKNGHTQPSYDFRPYITLNGRLLYLPSALGGDREYLNRPPLLYPYRAEELVEMGLSLRDEDIAKIVQVRAHSAIERTLYNWLPLVEQNESWAAVQKFISRLNRERLLRTAQESLSRLQKLVAEDSTRLTTHGDQITFDKKMIAELEGDAFSHIGPELPTVTHQSIQEVRPIQAGDTIVIKLTSLNHNRWQGGDSLKPGDSAIAQVHRVNYSGGLDGQITLVLNWKAGNIGSHEVTLDLHDFQLLGAYRIEATQIQSEIRRIEHEQRDASENARAQKLVLQSDLTEHQRADIVAHALENSRVRALSPSRDSYGVRTNSGRVFPPLPSHPFALTFVNDLNLVNLSGSDRAYRTPNQKWILLQIGHILEVRSSQNPRVIERQIELSEGEGVLHVSNAYTFVGSARRTYRVLHNDTGQQLGAGSVDGLMSIAVSPDDSLVALVGLGFVTFRQTKMGEHYVWPKETSWDASSVTYRLYDAAGQSVVVDASGGRPGYFQTATFSNDGQYLFLAAESESGGNARLGVVRVGDQKPFVSVDSDLRSVGAIHVTPDRQHLVIVSRDGAQNRIFRVREDRPPHARLPAP